MNLSSFWYSPKRFYFPNYQREDGELTLDVGPFTAAVEFASDKTAVVVGKPDKAFFQVSYNINTLRFHKYKRPADSVPMLPEWQTIRRRMLEYEKRSKRGVGYGDTSAPE